MLNNIYNNRMFTSGYTKKNMVDRGRSKLSLVYTSSRDTKEDTVKSKDDKIKRGDLSS